MKRKKKNIIIFALIIIVCIIGICTQNENIIKYIKQNYDIDLSLNSDNIKENKDYSDDKENDLQLHEYKVVRVVDGDTFVIDYNGTNEKVRLIGVDTPESVHPNESKNTEEGLKISDYSKSRLSGKVVKLELDVQERDKYGRILAYVYIDGKMYNKELLELGYAKISTYPPNVKYVDDFKEIQSKARENKVGLWK